MWFLQRRRARRWVAVERARRALAHPPSVVPHSEDGNEAAIRAVEEMRATVDRACRFARGGSLAGFLLRDAELWITSWQAEWEWREESKVDTPHIFVRYRCLVDRLADIESRLSDVMQREFRESGGMGAGTDDA